MNKSINIIILGLGLIFSSLSYAAAIVVPYNGSFDEASIAAQGGLPAGDYDTIGGPSDVALFNLVEGANTFTGSIYSPADSSDFFNVGIGSDLILTGASINWGTNLPGIVWFPFGPFGPLPPADYRQQNVIDENAPDWFFEQSTTDPEIFTINDLGNSAAFGELGAVFSAPALNVTEGIYNSLLSAAGVCAQSYSIGQDGFYRTDCVDGIDYTMTFTVERVGNSSGVPAPAPLALLCIGLIALGCSRKRQA